MSDELDTDMQWIQVEVSKLALQHHISLEMESDLVDCFLALFQRGYNKGCRLSNHQARLDAYMQAALPVAYAELSAPHKGNCMKVARYAKELALAAMAEANQAMPSKESHAG